MNKSLRRSGWVHKLDPISGVQYRLHVPSGHIASKEILSDGRALWHFDFGEWSSGKLSRFRRVHMALTRSRLEDAGWRRK